MTETTTLRARTFTNRAMALGLAVEYLMTKPAFARLSFGHWSRILTGQIRRGHYVFACTDKKVVGFGGWAAVTEAEAEAWVTGGPEAQLKGTAGDCVVVNAWAADTPEVNDMLLAEALRGPSPFKTLYAKRQYADGRSRPVRIKIKDWLAAEAAKKAAAPGSSGSG
jgi:hemolysin-activating ACP:hemolysin acyltransferase